MWDSHAPTHVLNGIEERTLPYGRTAVGGTALWPVPREPHADGCDGAALALAVSAPPWRVVPWGEKVRPPPPPGRPPYPSCDTSSCPHPPPSRALATLADWSSRRHAAPFDPPLGPSTFITAVIAFHSLLCRYLMTDIVVESRLECLCSIGFR